MKIIKFKTAYVLTVGLGLCCVLFCARVSAAESDSAIPSVIRSGFEFFQKQRPEQGVDAWKEGGLVGEEFKSGSHAIYFRQAERTLGKYVSYEWVTTKMVGKSSKVIYLAINYEHGAVYARFLVYRTEKDWVVQSMNFNTRPEALMPWLAFEEGE
jgi:hypothetical protein